MKLVVFIGGGWWRREVVEVEGGLEGLGVPGEGVGGEAFTKEVGHEGVVDGGGVSCSQDGVPTLLIIVS